MNSNESLGLILIKPFIECWCPVDGGRVILEETCTFSPTPNSLITFQKCLHSKLERLKILIYRIAILNANHKVSLFLTVSLCNVRVVYNFHETLYKELFMALQCNPCNVQAFFSTHFFSPPYSYHQLFTPFIKLLFCSVI